MSNGLPQIPLVSLRIHIGVDELYDFRYRGTDDAYAQPLLGEAVQKIQQHLDECAICQERLKKLIAVPPMRERLRCM